VEDSVRVRLFVRGLVQGVGFRPYVYRLAQTHALAGFVMNTPVGVVIEIEGGRGAVEGFVAALPVEGPPLMQISSVERAEIAVLGDEEFLIRESVGAREAFTLVPPDVCVCAECLAEVRDPGDRRYEYPFANCTNCGPRYSIILDVPYDRAETTMAAFTMCADCQREYEDPVDRRFHAQPNACPVCGPRMELVVPGCVSVGRDVIEGVAEILRAGGIVAWKGLGGYQLACDARNGVAVEELRKRKRRSEKAFAVMVGDMSTAEEICVMGDVERRVLVGRERPIVLLQRKEDAGLAEAVSPENPMTGVMLPCTPMHDLLFRILRERCDIEPVLVMTSGNVSEEPIVIENAEAEVRLAGIADAFAHHDRGIHTRVDDSIVRVIEGEARVLRRARGHAPQPLWMGLGDAEVLAFGAQQKSTFCLTKAGFAIPSQHLGDLENYETLEFFEQTLERMQQLFHAEPRVVAHDLHPRYLSTQLALKRDTERRIGVQHHHAHIASCMVEHGLRGRVIGVAWDGTGYGTDGTAWGGEFLAAELRGFERYGHLRNVLLVGGDAAVREPWRMARSYLRDAFDTAIPDSVRFPQSVGEDRVRLVDAMLEKRIQTIETSSCGRLFDAVAALIGVRSVVSFEGQAAMRVEAIAVDDVRDGYEFAVAGERPAQVDMRPMVRQIVSDVERGVSAGVMAARFHNTLVAVVRAMCGRMREELGLARVCLSGGCFQNARLLHGSVEGLRADGFEVFFHREIPPNDGGISVGQAAIACELVQRGL
jgi:hydrogenase maturation protein HypF